MTSADRFILFLSGNEIHLQGKLKGREPKKKKERKKMSLYAIGLRKSLFFNVFVSPEFRQSKDGDQN